MRSLPLSAYNVMSDGNVDVSSHDPIKMEDAQDCYDTVSVESLVLPYDASPHEYIYKIVTEEEFERIQKQGAFDGSELDHKDGFIHCSTEDQIEGTIQKFFKGCSNLILLTINPEGLDVRFESSSRSHQLYPHIFEPLPIESVVASKKIL